MKREAPHLAKLLQTPSQLLVGCNTPRNHQPQRRDFTDAHLRHVHRACAAICDSVGNGSLEGSRDVRCILIAQRRQLLRETADRRLQSCKREVQLRPPNHRTRQIETLGTSSARSLLYCRTTWKT